MYLVSKEKYCTNGSLLLIEILGEFASIQAEC